jgi:hypothetical protein
MSSVNETDPLMGFGHEENPVMKKKGRILAVSMLAALLLLVSMAGRYFSGASEVSLLNAAEELVGIACPGLSIESNTYCDCDGDCTEMPQYCACAEAQKCCGFSHEFGWLKDYGATPKKQGIELGHCEGDCDSNDDCKEGLECFERLGHEYVPGCKGSGVWGYDYCVKPGLLPLSFLGHEPGELLKACEGDCDHDWDCAGTMVCFQRDGNTNVPGCKGPGEKDYDYCIDDQLLNEWKYGAYAS